MTRPQLTRAWGTRRLARSCAALVPALAILATVAAGAGAAPPVGISDNKPSTFSDPRFGGLGIKYARLVKPYDVALTDGGGIDDWLAAAAAAGVEPHVAFAHRADDVNCPAGPCELPTVAAYTVAFNAFRARHPEVRVFTPWNEANHDSQPTWRNPERAAAYYNVVRTRCPECLIVAGDVLDFESVATWIRTYRARLVEQPAVWGLHNYRDVNDGVTRSVDELLDLVDGDVWLTETGGIVSLRGRDGNVAIPYNEYRAARAVRRVFDLLARPPGRVTRAYLYHWQTVGGEAFDAGLIRPDGTPRPAFAILQRMLRPQPGDRTFQPQLTLARSARLQPPRRVRMVLTCRAAGARCRGTLELVHDTYGLYWRGRFDVRSGRRAGVILTAAQPDARIPSRVRHLRVVARLARLPAPVRGTVQLVRPASR